MEQTTYLFIDGEYLRKIHADAMQRVFGVSGDLTLEVIAEQAAAFRSFFYDCEAIQGEKESQGDFETRAQTQREQFSRVDALRGFHLRTGTMRRGRKREQKEVDVLLAVDMMTHGFNRNMTRAVLITGDLDFRPVVEALVRGGVFVEIWYEKASTALALPQAADFGVPIHWHQFYRWNSEAFRRKFQAPTQVGGSPIPANSDVQARGTFEGRPVHLIKLYGNPSLALCVERPHGLERYLHNDANVLSAYFCELHGPIQWP
jgi:uncharacterized LabA/DUF88 family protein